MSAAIGAGVCYDMGTQHHRHESRKKQEPNAEFSHLPPLWHFSIHKH
jgi:hypothetical protein